MVRTWSRLGSVVIAVLFGAGCGGDEPASEEPTAVATPEPEIVAVYRDFEYYGPCGNETVLVEGIVFSPVPTEPTDDVVPGVAAIDQSRYPLPPDLAGVARVAPPGPGDDIGTMIVYSDGLARFESDSGWIIWLTDQEQTYGWAC